MSAPALPSRFEPRALEERWQAFWKERQLFRAPSEPRGRTFAIVLPPPNVTGILTIGHMLGDTVQDLLVRWHMMRGESALWMPGVDHAGLATQVEVRKRLAKEGVRLEELAREEVVARVEEWKREHEARILEQMRAGGFAIDESRYRYTMDDGFRRVTREAFVRLYREGLIYRGERIVNWDPKLRTAVSDLEVVHAEEPATLLYVRYPWADGRPGGLVVATVRPETIFGDVAVAVHPTDARHADDVGRSVRVPLTDRLVPVIADDLVDPTFGNGALKVTPLHDKLDFQIGRRHPELLRPEPILDPGAHLTGPWVPERYRGLDREKARSAVAVDLTRAGFVEREESYRHSVGRSERSDAVIEPRLSTQWFVRMPALAPPVVEAVRAGAVRLHPERWELTFFRWMESLEDWCISRQISWGHPVPVLYCDDCQTEIVEAAPPERCPKCRSSHLRSDPDVLDTWFSSWLWPFAGLGWPDPTPELAAYFPTSVLVTGRDIMFFWVARMLMASYHFTGGPPFRDVYFTGMLRDEKGRRMSKHLGNSPDPLEVIRRWGSDAMRFALVFPNPTDQDGPFREANLEAARNFLTKCWNLLRLLQSHLPPGGSAPSGPPVRDPGAPLEERWILSRYRRVVEESTAALEAFEFTRAASAIREFLWHDVADRYVEISKEALSGQQGEGASRRARETLHFLLERLLRLLHPFVPHLTEELWHAIPHEGETLLRARWPEPEMSLADGEAELAMESVLEVVRLLRGLRAENGIPPGETPAAWLRPASPVISEVVLAELPTVLRLSRVGSLRLLGPGEALPEGALTAVAPVGELFMARPPASERSDWEAMLREKEKLSALLRKAEGRLSDAGFLARAPPPVVDEVRSKAAELAERIRRIDEHLMSSREPPARR